MRNVVAYPSVLPSVQEVMSRDITSSKIKPWISILSLWHHFLFHFLMSSIPGPNWPKSLLYSDLHPTFPENVNIKSIYVYGNILIKDKINKMSIYSMGIHRYGLNIKGIRCRGHLHILYGDLGDDPVVSMNGYPGFDLSWGDVTTMWCHNVNRQVNSYCMGKLNMG